MAIAIIGPAPHILDKDQTDYINSFDKVVRLNSSLPIPENIKKVTGDRCDIFYSHSHLGFPSPELSKVEKIRVRPDCRWTGESNYREKIEVIPHSFLEELRVGIGYETTLNITTGMLAICHLFKEEKLYITGFTFFKTKCYKGYFRENEYYEYLEKFGHKTERELQYFIKNIYPHVKCDKELQQLVSNYSSKGRE